MTHAINSTLHIAHNVTMRTTNSPRVLATAALFGLPLHPEAHVTIIPPIDVPLPAGGIVFITGPSGSGKSTLLRIIAARSELPVIDIDALPDLSTCDAALVDVFAHSDHTTGEQSDEGAEHAGESLHTTIGRLARVGLADAFVILRRPRELSDGQRMRLRMAQAMHAAERGGRAQHSACLIVIDEFCAALDRMTAQTISRNLARWVRTTAHTLIIATAHDDVLEALDPNVLVYKGLGDAIEVCVREG